MSVSTLHRLRPLLGPSMGPRAVRPSAVPILALTAAAGTSQSSSFATTSTSSSSSSRVGGMPRVGVPRLRLRGILPTPTGLRRRFHTSVLRRRLEEHPPQPQQRPGPTPVQQQQDTAKPAQDKLKQAAATVEQPSFAARLKKSWNETPTTWYPIPISLGIAVLVALNLYKQQGRETNESGDSVYVDGNQVRVKGPWQVHVLGALPLRTMSRIYGLLNSYELPVWFRVPGYKFYAFLFGVKLHECDPEDLKEYKSMSEFFMRKLKPGLRPIDSAILVSPADGRVVNFGVVEGGRVEQVKGSTYSLDALLSGTGQAGKAEAKPAVDSDGSVVDEREFADINGIQYSLDELLGSKDDHKMKDASLSTEEQADSTDKPKRSFSTDAQVAMDVAPWSSAGANAPKEGNKVFFAVVYLAPGDYHRFHSPTSWVVEQRRHFAGELFSVSPWMANKLQDLFVLNERVALLGRWRHGFFSFVPVGATNVGSIRINFDSSLRTNSPLRQNIPGTFTEATYAGASALLRGQPLKAGDEMGGFWLGSTVVLVFEAPEKFQFAIKKGQKVQVGEKLGDVEA